MESIKIIVTKEEILSGKFSNTLSTIEGYLKEAEGDIDVSQSYSPEAVYERIEDIKNVFNSDLLNLSKNIEI